MLTMATYVGAFLFIYLYIKYSKKLNHADLLALYPGSTVTVLNVMKIVFLASTRRNEDC